MSDQAALAQGEEELLAKTSKVDKAAQFIVQLSLETPVERTLANILNERYPVRVGRLRYVLGSELLTELLMRGAESLEEEFPGSLGLDEHLKSLHKKESPAASPPLRQAKETAAEKWKQASRSPRHSLLSQDEKNPAPAEAGLTVSKLDLSGFDFGSSPVHPKCRGGEISA